MSADWVLHCQPWLNEEGALYELQDVSTPPLKDFYMLVVDPYQVGFKRLNSATATTTAAANTTAGTTTITAAANQ